MGGSLGRRHSGSVMELQPREEGWKWCGVAGWGEGWGREGERSTRGAGLGNEEHLIAREVASVAPQRENPGQHSGAGDASAREHGTQRLSSGPFSKQSGVGRWMTCMAKWPMLAICWPYAHVGHMATVLAGTTSGVAGHWPQGRCTHAPAAAAAVSLHHRPRRVLQQFVPAVAGSQGPKCMLGSFSGPHNPTPPYTTQHTHTHTQLHRPPQPWLDVLMLHSTKPEQKPCRAWPASARSAAECRAWQEGRPVLAGRKRATAPAGFRQRAGGSQHVVEVGGDVGDRERGVTGHNHLGSCAVVLHKGLQAQGGGGAQVRWPCRTSGTRPYCSKAAHCARMAQGRCFWFHTAAQHTRKHAPCGQSPTCLQREAAKSTASARFSCVHTMPAQPTEHSTGLALGVGASETRQRTGRWCRLHVRRKR